MKKIDKIAYHIFVILLAILGAYLGFRGIIDNNNFYISIGLFVLFLAIAVTHSKDISEIKKQLKERSK